MVASWVKRSYSGTGVTQYRPGPHLAAVQQHLLGWVLLCIDVSGSMSGSPLRAAIDGGLDFLTEAEQSGYRCGLVLWDDGVDAHLPPTADKTKVRALLSGASIGGGTNLRPTIELAIKELGPLLGDRVMCVFGDGDVGNEKRTAEAAARARGLGIRFVVRGLGAGASACLARTLTPEEKDETQTVQNVADLRSGIASMARSLKIGR